MINEHENFNVFSYVSVDTIIDDIDHNTDTNEALKKIEDLTLDAAHALSDKDYCFNNDQRLEIAIAILYRINYAVSLMNK